MKKCIQETKEHRFLLDNSIAINPKLRIWVLGHIAFILQVLFRSPDVFGVPPKIEWVGVPWFVTPCGMWEQYYLSNHNSYHGEGKKQYKVCNT
jgi:hypothetical protein